MANYISPNNTRLDANQVLIRAYDEPNNRLRVDAQVTASIGTLDVIIDAAGGDNIAISDGVNTLEINPDGSINIAATNLDIRDLVYTQDTVGAYVRAGTDGDPISSLNYGGSEWLQTASNLVDSSGVPLNVTGGNLNVIINSGSISFNGQYNEDSTANNGDVGLSILAVRQDSLINSTSSDGDYSNLKTTQLGELYTHDVDLKNLLTTIDSNIDIISNCVVAGSLNVAVTSSVLPSGAATEATLANIDSKINTTINGVKVDAYINNQPPDPSTGTLQLAGNTTLTNINNKLPTLGPQTVSNSISVTLATNQPSIAIDANGFDATNPDSIQLVGSIDGTSTGSKYGFINNLRQQIMSTQNRQSAVTYADFGSKDQRITRIDFTSALFPGYTVRKDFLYVLDSGRYRRTNINWSIV